MNKKLKIISIFVALLLFFLVVRHQIVYPYLHVEYNGLVTKCVFDVKGYSKFQINQGKKWYEMHYLNCDLKIGDSLIKKLDMRQIYHYRNGKLIGVYGAVLGQRLNN